MNKKFQAFAMMAGMLAAGNEPHGMPAPARRKKPATKKNPPGTKEFHFNYRGELLKEKSELAVFSCFALNEANARRKLLNSLPK